jgi:hypothetical protein
MSALTLAAARSYVDHKVIVDRITISLPELPSSAGTPVDFNHPQAKLGDVVRVNSDADQLENSIWLVHEHVLSDGVIQIVLFNGGTTQAPQETTFNLAIFKA